MLKLKAVVFGFLRMRQDGNVWQEHAGCFFKKNDSDPVFLWTVNDYG